MSKGPIPDIDTETFFSQNLSGGRPIAYSLSDYAQFQNELFNPAFTMLEGFAGVFVLAAQPRAPQATIDAVKSACVI